jgi:two-component system, OmpR family, KDP operon response regulator KdpE
MRGLHPVRLREAKAVLGGRSGPWLPTALASRPVRSSPPNSIRVLVIHADPPTRRLIRIALHESAYVVREATTGLAGLDEAAFSRPDLVILDLELPDMTGIEAIRRLRESGDVRILVLSTRTSQEDKVRALDSGAEDVLVNPFDAGELLARIRVLFRPNLAGDKSAIVDFGRIQVDLVGRIVTNQGRDVRLTATEFDVLKLLISNNGKIVSHRKILREVWGQVRTKKINYLRIYMHRLRQKLEDNPHEPTFLLTASGLGYRLKIMAPETTGIP